MGIVVKNDLNIAVRREQYTLGLPCVLCFHGVQENRHHKPLLGAVVFCSGFDCLFYNTLLCLTNCFDFFSL